jgi:hypothetical protein
MSQAPPLGDAGALRSVHTSNLPALFDQLRISLVVSTYQAGKVIVVRNDRGSLNTHFRTFSKPMGIVADTRRLTIGGYQHRLGVSQHARRGAEAGAHWQV